MNTVKLGLRKYRFSEVLETNISTEYLGDEATNWGIWEMMRECFQNIMDEAQVSANGGHLADHLWVDTAKVDGEEFHRLRDKGRGADLNQILYLGWSGKRGQGMRGEKGEGQLLAFLVSVKKGIESWFVSKDYAIQPFISADNGHPHLALRVYKTSKTMEGTQILIEKGDHEVEVYIRERRYYFPDLRKPRKAKRKNTTRKAPSVKKSFPDKRGQSKLYLKGIFVKDIDALFSYNLKNTKISRDRDMVSEEDLLIEIAEIWDSEKRHKHLTALINAATGWGCSEMEMRIEHFDPEYPAAWRSAFRKVSGGRRAVLWTNDIVAREVCRSGYKVLKIERLAVILALDLCGIKYDKDVVKTTDPYRVLKTDSREQKLFKIFAEIIDLCSWNETGFKIFKPSGSDSRYDNRIAFHLNGEEYYLRSYIKEASFKDVLQTFIHEETHKQFGAPDESREFEKGQAKLWMDIVEHAALYVHRQIRDWR